jgi:hypothetical protein
LRRASLAVLLSLSAIGCGGTGTTNDVSNPVLACRSIASAACTRLSQCEPAQDIDPSTCAQLLQTNRGCDSASCSTGTTYSPTAAQQCVNDTSNQDCTGSENNVLVPSCQPDLICIPNS